MNKPLLEVKSLYKTFDKQPFSILNNISFDLYEGDSMAITGVSGSGKSTLLHMLAGLDHPSSGEVNLCNHALSNMNNQQLAEIRGHLVGFIF